MTESGKLLYLQWFRGMGIYIFQNMIKRHSMFSARTCLSFFCACFAGYRNQKTIDEIKSDYVKIYEYLFPKLLKKKTRIAFTGRRVRQQAVDLIPRMIRTAVMCITGKYGTKTDRLRSTENSTSVIFWNLASSHSRL